MKRTGISISKKHHLTLLLPLVLCLLLTMAACGNTTESGVTRGDGTPSESAMYAGGSAAADNSEISLTKQDQTVTLMVYMIGSDLESGYSAATTDMQEMLDSGLDRERVQLLIMTGGSEAWYSDVSAEVLTILRLGENGFETIKTMDSASMGESETLEYFLRYGYENYPADSYDLILWDHGNGPLEGYGRDRLFDGDSLTLKELKTALEASPFSADNKLGFVGFDACLMSSAELACTMADYADYLVASQEVEPCFGWNYAFLNQCGYVTDASLATYAVECYSQFCEDYFAENPLFSSDVTMALIDLQYAQELETAVNALFQKAGEDVSGDYNLLALNRVQTRALGRATTGSEYDLVDLDDLMSCMAEKYPEETASVRQLVQKIVLWSRSNTDNVCGISFYYPYYNKNYYKNSWKERYAELGVFNDYRTYLERYEQIWLGTDLQDYFSEPLTPEEYTPGNYTLSLTEEQASVFAEGGYYVLRRYGEDLYSAISYNPNVALDGTTLTADFDGKTLVCTNDYGDSWQVYSENCVKIDQDSYYTIRYTASTLNLEAFGTWSNLGYEDSVTHYELQLQVDSETDAVTVQGLYTIDDSTDRSDELQSGKLIPYDFDTWRIMNFKNSRPSYPVRDAQGRLLPYDEWVSGDWILSYEAPLADGLRFSYEPFYDDGSEYFLMFSFSDLQGNVYTSEFLPITPAQAPKAEPETYPQTEISWEDSHYSPTVEESGISLRLTSNCDHESGAPLYGMEITNENAFPVRISIENILLNDSLQVSTGSAVCSLDSGETKILMIPEITDTMRYSGVSRPEEISFLLTAKHGLEGSTLIRGLQVNAAVADTVTPELWVMPYHGVTADEQVLLETEELRITLLSLGRCFETGFVSLEQCAAVLKIETFSDASGYLTIPETRVNDVADKRNMSELLEPNTCIYKGLTWSTFSIEDKSNKPLQEVTSIDLHITYAATISEHYAEEYILDEWFTVNLTQESGDIEQKEAE